MKFRIIFYWCGLESFSVSGLIVEFVTRESFRNERLFEGALGTVK